MNTATRLPIRRVAAALAVAAAGVLGSISLASPATAASEYLVPGSHLVIEHYDGTLSDCTAGPVVSYGNNQRGVITAGHCGEDGESVVWEDSRGREYKLGNLFHPIDKLIKNVRYDYALVPVDESLIDMPVAGKYIPSTYLNGEDILKVQRSGAPIHLCSVGIMSGERCGDVQVETNYGSIPRITSSFSSIPGDSGGPVFAKRTDGYVEIVGILRGSENATGRAVIVPIQPALDMYNVKLSIGRK